VSRAFFVAALVVSTVSTVVVACGEDYGADEATPPLPERDAGDDGAPIGATDASGTPDDAAPGGDAGADVVGSTVTGQLNFVNASGFSATSVILVPDTVDPNGFRTAVPIGPKVSGVNGNFAISPVPAGTYWVLPAYENDGVVSDPSEPLRKVTVDGKPTSTVAAGSFKVTGALELVGIDPKASAAKITFKDDSSEDDYVFSVIDEMSAVVASGTAPAVSGSSTVSIMCPQPLSAGQKYRFRVSSRRTGVLVARTEDLACVFTAAP
jgi:hypothetical protein